MQAASGVPSQPDCFPEIDSLRAIGAGGIDADGFVARQERRRFHATRCYDAEVSSSPASGRQQVTKISVFRRAWESMGCRDFRRENGRFRNIAHRFQLDVEKQSVVIKKDDNLPPASRAARAKISRIDLSLRCSRTRKGFGRLCRDGCSVEPRRDLVKLGFRAFPLQFVYVLKQGNIGTQGGERSE